MKISLSWLSHWIKNIPDDLDHRLTMAGLEVESINSAAPFFSGVVIGEVIDLQAHPDADKLRIAQVNIGTDAPLQIVCGAPNVALGIKVPTALIGAVLPNDFKIKPAQLRGVDSCGMLCSARELGLSEDHAGLMILDASLIVGANLREVFDLDDKIIEIDLTPNRGDCLSMLGIAREVAAITNQVIKLDPIEKQKVTIDDVIKINIESPKDCARYLGRFIKNLNPDAPTPFWMSERLRRAGIREHGILVDITNYILIEMGQPLHAFAADKIAGDIYVRRAMDQETLILLDGSNVTLDPNILVIADAKKALAIAGVMGGQDSACNDKTTHIFLESAWFNPITLAGKARQFGLQSDAAHRYERGVDFNLGQDALERATQLLIELAGGEAGAICKSEFLDDLPKRNPITLNFARVNKIIGMNLDAKIIAELLKNVGNISEINQESLVILAPSYRYDLMIEEDIIEEIARLYGYDNIPVNISSAKVQMHLVPENKTPLTRFKEVLIARDYIEVITMSFVKPGWQAVIDPSNAPIILKNPISPELSAMRTTLLPGLLSTIDYNFKRQQKRIRIFESGSSFKGGLENLEQSAYLSGAICGESKQNQWGETARKVDFFDIKGDVEALLAISGMQDQFSFVASSNAALHPGQGADIVNQAGDIIGYVGALHPALTQQLDLDVDIFVFELKIEALSLSLIPKFCEIPKFPSSKRDLALLIPKEISANQVISTIISSDNTILQSVHLFDIYTDDLMKAGERSMAFTLFFQNVTENLKDYEIDAIISKVLMDLKLINATLR